jgi:hypothetical protein
VKVLLTAAPSRLGDQGPGTLTAVPRTTEGGSHPHLLATGRLLNLPAPQRISTSPALGPGSSFEIPSTFLPGLTRVYRPALPHPHPQVCPNSSPLVFVSHRNTFPLRGRSVVKTSAPVGGNGTLLPSGRVFLRQSLLLHRPLGYSA